MIYNNEEYDNLRERKKVTIEQIETFQAVVSSRNITSAANTMFITQSTVSSRIQALEKELGKQLFIRSKGQHVVELTNYGKAFIPIANQWKALWRDTRQLTDAAEVSTLTVASIDSVNNCTFVPFFNQFTDTHTQIKLSIQTFHSNEIHGLIQNRLADIGFVFSRIQYPDVISKPIYRELMYLVCHRCSDYGDDISCEELNAENEIYLRWGSDYQIWHEQHWNPQIRPVVTVNTGSTLQRFLNKPNRWAIAPMSVVHQMQYNSDIVHYRLKEAPPPRICYSLMNRFQTAKQTAAIDIFNKELSIFVQKDSDICTFEKWMLPQNSTNT